MLGMSHDTYAIDGVVRWFLNRFLTQRDAAAAAEYLFDKLRFTLTEVYYDDFDNTTPPSVASAISH
jgi:hypothetical protein